MSYTLRIGHIYPDLLDMYGDRGNIASLVKRMQWRGMDADAVFFKSGDKIDFPGTDILLLGGGSDAAQWQALSYLFEYKEDFKKFAEDGGTVLALCGGYPLLGKYILEGGKKTECLGILDIYTENGDNRFTGNAVLECEIGGKVQTVVGFENHSGKTFTCDHTPLGKVVKGYGNGDGFEGVVYKNVFATYLHGPLLPKNPALADEIISRALKRKYGGEIVLSPLDDTLENNAHAFAENL